MNTELDFNDLPLISFVLPTLGREEGVVKCLKSIDDLYYPSNKKEVIVIKDSPRMGLPRRLKEGVSKSSGEYIVFSSDDLEFDRFCIFEALKEKKALVSFNSGPLYPDHGNICEHFIIKKSFIEKIGGEIFDTEFNHLGVDNLLWAKCLRLNEAVWCEKAIAHHHHFTKTGKYDAIYNVAWNADSAKKDRELLKKKLQELNL